MSADNNTSPINLDIAIELITVFPDKFYHYCSLRIEPFLGGVSLVDYIDRYKNELLSDGQQVWDRMGKSEQQTAIYKLIQKSFDIIDSKRKLIDELGAFV